MTRATACLAALVCSAAISACGGDQRSDVEQTVKDFVAAANDRDADKFCGELVTKSFLESTFGGGGDPQDACRRQFGRLRRVKVELVRVEDVKIDGDAATARAILSTQGQRERQTFHLKKENGRFKLTGSAPE